MPYGFNNRILHVDLTGKTISVEEPGENFYRTYGGGPGIALYYMLKDMPPGVDALGPENLLVFAPGLLTGTVAPCVPRYTVCARSPLTGAFGKSEAGGWWGPELKAAGYDAIVIKGQAEAPVYLWIDDGKVEIRDAGKIWGLETGPAAAAIKEELGDERVRIAQIGPAGENLVRYAAILNELGHFNGRNGLGAVMGSKKLKAIAVRATGRVEVCDPQRLKELSRWVSAEAKVHPLSKALHVMGTPGGVEGNNAAGALPTRNWTDGTFEGYEEISGTRLNQEILVKRGGCFSCPVRCKRVVSVSGEYDVDPRYGGPEYEALASLGSSCGISDLKLVAKANEVCNRYGLDVISAGLTIAFAMECFENGLLTLEDTGGLELRFGNKGIFLELLRLIAYREGFGGWLADGSVALAKRIGKGSERFLMHVKGQELPMHDPRVKTGFGMQYALAPQGADHQYAQHDPFFVPGNPLGQKAGRPLGILEGVPATDLSWRKVRNILYTSFLNFSYDSLGACVFGFIARSVTPYNILLEIIEAVTGWETSLWELMKIGERLNTMARLFNCREGFGRDDDRIPERLFTPLKSGPNKGSLAIPPDDFRKALDLYYAMAGWDEAGRPREGKLLELGLDWLAGV